MSENRTGEAEVAPETDRVRAHTSAEVNQQLDDERIGSVAAMVGAPPSAVHARLADLDQEWDVERVLEANAATLTLLGVGLGAALSRRWLLLAGVVPVFLLQHAVQGWCPPLAVLRRLGVRTRREIEAERTALKALRGDFDGLATDGPPRDSARAALRAVGRD